MAESRGINMSKIYDASGAKMNVAQICEELKVVLTAEQRESLSNACSKYEFDDSQMKLAHGILDSYRLIDSTSEQGMRARKLMDNLMTKYQKATPANTDDQMYYRNLLVELSK